MFVRFISKSSPRKIIQQTQLKEMDIKMRQANDTIISIAKYYCFRVKGYHITYNVA